MKGARLPRVLRSDDRGLSEDALTSLGLEPRFYGHAGFPEATDALAYDPVQRLLAVRCAPFTLLSPPAMQYLYLG